MPSGRPGQVDFSAGQVSFYSHLPHGQGIRLVKCQLYKKVTYMYQNLKATCLKGKQEFMGFLDLFSPVLLLLIILTCTLSFH